LADIVHGAPGVIADDFFRRINKVTPEGTINGSKSDLLAAQYSPVEVEPRRYAAWLASGAFIADPGRVSAQRPPYSMVIPPPNVTGSLHLGHALGHTLMDALSRRRRMQGFEVLWLPGMDHAGIATQTLVERQILTTEGLSRHEVGREEFVQRVWDWKGESGGAILGQMRRLGDGVDWSRERFTMDPDLSRAVHTVFQRLFNDGLIYRAERIIHWCPRCLTALSDIEVDHHDDDGELVSIRYGDPGGDPARSLVVATTRVETMLGDTAVAVHPEDDRYRHLIGTEVELPLTGRRIPVVADSHVDPEFGTGAVKVTPAHDPNDFAIGQRHGLPMVTVMDERGAITTPGPFEGLDRFEARPAMVRALREEGRIVAERRPYLHAVGHCSRCDSVIEPRLSLQWFVTVAPLAAAAGDAVRDGRVSIHPPEMTQRYFDWVDNMHDWCISRQLWWGHRIPMWYSNDGEMRCVGPDDDPPGRGWTQDADVLDTWFSAALWPLSTLGWPAETPDLKAFYPTSVLVTGYDIIFFWVARMMMFGLYARPDAVPFTTIILHGLVRDAQGRKMSKSRGNTVDPLDWIEAYGSDAVRFSLARGANPGTDVPIGEEWVRGSRNFCTKVWNATRFALINGASVAGELPATADMSVADQWILSQLAEVLADVDTWFEDFQFAKIVDRLYHFVWDDICDWYVELSKVHLPAPTTQRVLGEVLEVTLRMLHPIMPFITDELWCALTGRDTVVRASWPTQQSTPPEEAGTPNAVGKIAAVKELVSEIRQIRQKQGVPPSRRIPAAIDEKITSRYGPEVEPYIRSLARLVEPSPEYTATATALIGGYTLTMDLGGVIDVAAERARLRRKGEEHAVDLAKAVAKLDNPAFVDNAPAAVVKGVENRRVDAEAALRRIEQQLRDLPGSTQEAVGT
jgi:valyl-tRNA synthetase